MKTHKLKTWPEPFGLMESGLKPFEIRKNDRNFKVGDVLILQEWRPAEEIYTGRELLRRVESILDQEQFGLRPGFVAMAVAPVSDELFGDTFQSSAQKNRGSLEQVKGYAAMIRLGPEDGEWFYAKCEGCGWQNNKVPIKDWQATMRAGKLRKYFPSQQEQHGQKKELSVQELRTIAQAKETKCAELKRRYCSEVALGDEWSDPGKRQEFSKLRREIKEINNRISNFA